MLFRDKVALNVPSLLLRVMLAVTFLYAGAGKLQKVDFTGEQAQRLHALGMTGQAASTIQNETQPQTPPEETPTEGEEETQPATTPPAETPAPTPTQEQAPAQSGEATDTESVEDAPATTAPETVRKQALYGIALMVDSAANPSEGQAQLLPAWMGAGKRAAAFAWLATVAELAGGALLLLGLFTRLWALAVAGVMGMALWLTQIGPVVLGGAAGFYGVLPAHNNFAPGAWDTWLWQFSLLTAALAVFFLGAGALSLDRMLFPKPHAAGARPAPPPPAKES